MVSYTQIAVTHDAKNSLKAMVLEMKRISLGTYQDATYTVAIEYLLKYKDNALAKFKEDNKQYEKMPAIRKQKRGRKKLQPDEGSLDSIKDAIKEHEPEY